jgi:hypothetical protein
MTQAFGSVDQIAAPGIRARSLIDQVPFVVTVEDSNHSFMALCSESFAEANRHPVWSMSDC